MVKKSIERAIGLLERGNEALALEALREASAAADHVPDPEALIHRFVEEIKGYKPWTGLADLEPLEIGEAIRVAVAGDTPVREVPLDNYSHSIVCLVGFEVGDPHIEGEEKGASQVLVECVELDDAKSQAGLPSPNAEILVRNDDSHPTSFEFTIDTPERADAAIAALQGARMIAFGEPPAGRVVSRT